jgi:hypothetical protein
MDLYTLTIKYFEAFSNKDLDTLEALYAQNVYLRDWQGTHVGMYAVLTENKRLFADADAIVLRPVALHCDLDASTIAAELEIMISAGEETHCFPVVDIVEFNEAKEIVSIRAYKGSE